MFGTQPDPRELVAAKTAIVTGAGSGIGAALVTRLAGAGARVLATDIDKGALDAQNWPDDAVRRRGLDVRDPEAWAAAVADIVETDDRLDLCFNVAGYLMPGATLDITPDLVDRHIDVNAKGVIYGTQASARQMVDQGAGHIVNIASLASLAPVPGLALYAASKFAMRGFSLAAALELKERGVAVTVVCPDAVDTPMLDLQLDYPEAALTFSGAKPLEADQVVDVLLGRVLTKRPIQTTISIAGRGQLAKFSNVFPEIASMLGDQMRNAGLRNQARLRDRPPTE